MKSIPLWLLLTSVGISYVPAMQASYYYGQEPVSAQTIVNWFNDEIDRIFQPGLQNSEKKSVLENFKRYRQSDVLAAVKPDSTASRQEMKKQVDGIARNLSFEFIMNKVRQAIDSAIYKLNINPNWLNSHHLVNDIVSAYQDTVLNLLSSNQRLTNLYRDLERNIEGIVKSQLGMRH